MALETEPEQNGPRRGPIWRRGGIALIFLIAVEIGQLLMNVTAVLQFGWMLFTGRPNAYLTEFGQSLSIWLRDASAFVTCASEVRPFPWKAWPRPE